MRGSQYFSSIRLKSKISRDLLGSQTTSIMKGFKNIYPLTKLTILFILGMLSLASGLPQQNQESQRDLSFDSPSEHIFNIIMKIFVSSPSSRSNTTLSSMFKTEGSPLIAKFVDMLQKDYLLFRIYECNKIRKFYSRVLPEQSKSLLFICTWQGKSLLKLEQNSPMKKFHSFVAVLLHHVSVHFPLLWNSTKVFHSKYNRNQRRERLNQVEMEEEQADTGASSGPQANSQARRGRGKFTKVRTFQV